MSAHQLELVSSNIGRCPDTPERTQAQLLIREELERARIFEAQTTL